LKFKKNKRKKAYFDSPVRIAIQNNQGFGDCLMEAAFWKEVKKQIPDIIIDYFARSYAAFAKNPLFNVTAPYSQKLDYKKYDLVLLNDRLYRVKKYNREKIKLKAPLLMKYVDETTKILGILPNMNYAVIAGFAALFGKNRRGHFDIRDIFSYDADTKPFVSWNLDAFSVLDEYQLKHNAYMTVSRACDDIFKNGHVKMWPLKYYNELIKLLKEKRPDIKIVQLGSSKDYGSIDGVDINLLSKTSFDELNVLLKYSLLHIDSDGGLVHLRNALGGKSCVVWGPTSPDIFGYSENINITSKACVNSCSYLSKNWARQCIRGFNESKCMTSINPETVADEIIKYIDSISERNFELYLVNNEVLSTFLQEYSSKNIKTALFASDFADYFQIPNIDLYVCDSTKILKNGNCAPELSFIYNIGKAGNSYDAVFVNMPLDEKYKEFFYKEMGRILKPGGKCYMFS
jgi:ADP-heptose:LPS heptosyltransferase